MRTPLAAVALLALLALSTSGCARVDLPPAVPAAEPAAACVPGRTVRAGLAAGTPLAARELATWEAAWSPEALDRVLLGPRAIARLNGRNADRPGTWQDVIAADRGLGRIEGELAERFAHLRESFVGGGLVEEVAGSFGAAQAVARGARPVDELRVVVHPVDLRCVPSRGGFFRQPIDRDFDRNQCAELHPGALVRVGLTSPDGRWQYVHAGHAVGWVEEATLTPPLSPEAARAYRDDGARAVVVDDWVATEGPAYLRLGTDLPLLGRDDDTGAACVLAPTELGLEPLWVPDGGALHEGFLPLTRRNVLALVAARMGDPYGWGGVGGGRDCSRLLLDVMATFGVRLGRHSSVQAGSGALTVDVAGLSEEAKLAAVREAGQRGVVFLYMRGHIMLYLGELDGRPWAASSISEYLVPCAGGGHQTVRLDKVEVTTLELGRGTERTAFIERIATLAVFGPP